MDQEEAHGSDEGGLPAFLQNQEYHGREKEDKEVNLRPPLQLSVHCIRQSEVLDDIVRMPFSQFV